MLKNKNMQKYVCANLVKKTIAVHFLSLPFFTIQYVYWLKYQVSFKTDKT